MKRNVLKEINGEWLSVVEEVPTEAMPYVEDKRTYEQKVEDYVRERYSVSAELAILRQRDVKPDEFDEYNTYVEECKSQIKSNVGVGDKELKI